MKWSHGNNGILTGDAEAGNQDKQLSIEGSGKTADRSQAPQYEFTAGV
jgi:hypothetical protein